LTNWHDHSESILRTGKVLKVIPVYDQNKFARELENISQALILVQDLEVHPCLAVGQKVIIAEGPLAGIEGVVNDASQPGRVFLNVEMFNRAVVVKVAPEQLMPVEDRLGIRGSVLGVRQAG
jgi:transcription antitermination factor NusG